MELYLFKSANSIYSSSFRRLINRQNFKVAEVSAYVIIVFCLFAFTTSLLIGLNHLPNNGAYRGVFSMLFFASIGYAIIFQLIKRLTNKRTRFIASYLSANTFALIIITGMMWVSFIAQHNPANTMTMFLVGMFYVATLWLFDIWEALAVMILSTLLFYFGLKYFQTDHAKLINNYMVGAYIMFAFYMISRMLYSYHLNYFIQFRTIEAKNQEINKINKMQTDMLGIVVHDLRSPINSITTLTDLVKNYADSEPERQEYYEMILAACSEADHIIQDLIAVAKEQDQNINFSETSVNSLLTNIHQTWQFKLSDNRQLVLKQNINDAYAMLDSQKMQRVIDNLISNAIKFTHEDGIIQIILKEKSTGVLRICITDDGVGVPENLLPYLFDRFSKAGRLGLKGEKSHGLGLSICRQIVEQHSGAIGVESTEAKGTTFYIDLPVYNKPVVSHQSALEAEQI